jgi:hydroxycarboxylate dehydrogenase B
MLIPSPALVRLTTAIMQSVGSKPAEAAAIARRLVDSNLVGHDSHGVIRVPFYVQLAKDGHQQVNQHVTVLFESDSIVTLDGNRGFGQVIGEEAMARGIAKAKAKGIALIALRNSGHLGRMGDWADLAVAAGCVSLHFLNTVGSPIVAPFGGAEPRLSTNPITIGVPVPGRLPIVLDMTTSAVAHGKISVARNKGEEVPAGWIIDRDGRPTTDPNDLFEGGSMLPIAGHKGSGLSILTDLLAGALTGGSSSVPKAAHMVNNMLAIVIDPSVYADGASVMAEVRRFADWVASARPAVEGGEVLLPGEIEARIRARRLEEGIPVDATTWGQLQETAGALGIDSAAVERLLAG